MRMLKINLILILLTVMTCSLSCYANIKRYTNITLKKYNNSTIYGPQTKENNGRQYYESFGTINNCTANQNVLSARVVSDDHGTSKWINVEVDTKVGWTKDKYTQNAGNYNIELKNDTYSLCTASHSGIWYLDNVD